MLSERLPSSVRPLVTLLGGILAAALLAPTTAAAGDDASPDSRDPLTYLPSESRFAAHVDVDSLRQSKYFEKGMTYLEERSGDDDAGIGQFLSDDEGFDLRSDLHTIAVGLPVSRVDASSEVERGTFVFSGDFDEQQIRKAVKEQQGELATRTHAGLDAYKVNDAEFALPTSERLIVTMGPESYRNAVWSLAADGGVSFEQTADKHGLLDGVDTSRTVWMVNRLKGAQDRTKSKVDSAGISLTIEKGLDLQVVTRMASEADAKAVVQQVEAMKKSGSENSMLMMFGAGPLVSNLAVERDGTTAVATTSMTEPELDVLVEKVRQVASSQSRMSIPSSSSSSSGDSESTDSSTTPDDAKEN